MTMRERVVVLTDGENEYDEAVIGQFCGDNLDLTNKPAYFTVHESALLNVVVEYDSEPVIAPHDEKTLRLSLRNMLPSQKTFACRWILPEGWKVEDMRSIPVNQRFGGPAKVAEFKIIAGEQAEPRNRLVLELSCDSQHDAMYIPVVFLG